ncbi:hypothetical protein QQ045_017918 [Rhodiola kirilowii]
MEEILLRSLESLGVSIPDGVTSIQSLTPDLLFAICSQSLSIVDRASHFPESLPESTAVRFKVCKDMAAVFKEIGYLGDISFHQFLYPSEDDLYKLVRFLIEKLSESGAEVPELNKGNVASTSEHLRPTIELSETKDDGNIASEFLENAILKAEYQEDPLGVSRVNAPEKAESSHLIKTGCEVDDPQNKKIYNKNETVVLQDLVLDQSEEDPELWKQAMEMALNDQRPVRFYADQLTSQIDAKTSKLMELKSQWSIAIDLLEAKRTNLLDSLCVNNPDVQDKYHELKEVEAQMRSVISEISRRREERFKLLADLEKMPKVAPRRSYIQRINEITKNSRKLDADMERILQETRELQMGSNLTQESLHRTHAITSETILRDAKTNPVGQQAYKLLNNIHENFQQIMEKILRTDRLKREAADHEKKIASMASQSLDLGKLQADLDAISKENEALRKLYL